MCSHREQLPDKEGKRVLVLADATWLSAGNSAVTDGSSGLDTRDTRGAVSGGAAHYQGGSDGLEARQERGGRAVE